MDNPFDVSSEIIVVTGVAGQLGTAYAQALLGKGAKVVGLDVRRGEKETTLEAKHPERYIFVEADIISRPSLEAALARTTATFGTPSVLINNAAIDSPPSASAEENGPFESYPRGSWDKVMEVNVTGTYLACQVFGEVMAKAGRGSIINISSIYGVVSPDQSLYEYRRARGETFYKPVAYSVSKSAVLNLTRYLASYWAGKGVRVNTLVIAGVANNQDSDFLQAYCTRIPIGRMAEETEYNGAILFLASPASKYMTGAQLVMDGGWTAI
jgi:NAD(P)-dependent dehydrogenase (short-subunit alcohol dehydrogenase family)